jgi:hypothetical protein
MAKRAASDTVQISVRAKETLRAQLERAAKEHGVSMNAEIIKRLQDSFERQTSADDAFDAPVTAAIAKLIASAMHEAGRFAGFAATGTIEGATDWFTVPYGFAQAEQAATRVLEMLRPEGEPKPPDSLTRSLPDHHQVMGAGFANSVLEDAATGKSRTANTGPRAAMLHRELGPLADTIQANLKRKGLL